MTMRRSTLGRAFQTFQGRGPAGPRALVIAVIGRAALDLDQGDPAAAGFFLSEDYRRYLELIGLPADYLPTGVDAADLRARVEAAASRRARLCCKMSQNIAVAAD
jgi:hypothetical protein